MAYAKPEQLREACKHLDAAMEDLAKALAPLSEDTMYLTLVTGVIERLNQASTDMADEAKDGGA